MKQVIESKKVTKDIYAKLYSDLHYVPGDDLSFLENSIFKMQQESPDYVFFLGDLIDDSKYSTQDLKKLYDLMYKMTKLTKVIMVLGNHDQFTKDRNANWVDYVNNKYFNNLKNIGINLLMNSSYQDKDVFVYGTRFSADYYENKEPIEEFKKVMKLADFSESKQFNILLEHSPNFTFDSEVMKKIDNLKDVDLTLAGHFHNGGIPWYISKWLPTNIGLVDSYMRLFPKNARGQKQITETNYGIISNPITTFSSNNILHMVSPLYPAVEQNILIKKK